MDGKILAVLILDYGIFHIYNQFAVKDDIFRAKVSRRFCYATYQKI